MVSGDIVGDRTPNSEKKKMNQSKSMEWFKGLEFDRKVAVISFSLLIGGICGAMSFTGKATNTIRLCLKTPQENICKDSNNRPFEITPTYWEQWESKGRPSEAIVNEVLPATNPYKHLYALGAFLGFSFASWCFRAMQHTEKANAEYMEIAEQTALDIFKVKAQHQVEMTALDYSVVSQQAEIIGSVEAEITTLEARDTLQDAQLAGLCDEEVRKYLEYARDFKSPILDDISLGQVNRPKSKVVDESKNKQPELKGGISTQIPKLYNTGAKILMSMIASDKSILLASGTGTGKTTTERYYLTRYLEDCPHAQVWALLNKNDELPGAPERRTIFQPELLGTEPLENLLSPLFQVYRIYLDRKNKPGGERTFLKNNYPVRLVLGDWYGTYQELAAQLKREELSKVLSMTRQIITIGRDSGVSLFIDTQSPSLESLGLANDASIRQSLDIYSQGFIYDDKGLEKGELQTIRLTFSNNSICGKEERKKIQEDYATLCKNIQNRNIKSPIIFTSVGATPKIGIMPML